MNAQDKIYVREYPDGICRVWEDKKKDDVVATILHEYIRKDFLTDKLAHAKALREKSGSKDTEVFDALINLIQEL